MSVRIFSTLLFCSIVLAISLPVSSSPWDAGDARASSAWSDWRTSSCYARLDYRVRHDGRTDEGKHRWSMELRNRYREPVHVSWALADYEVAYRDIEVIRDEIGIGGSVSHGFDIESSPAGQFRVRIHRVRLGERDEGDYRGCDKM